MTLPFSAGSGDPSGRTGPPAIHVAVAELRTRGLAVCRINPTTKQANNPEWSSRSLEPSDFVDGGMVGIVCGWPSDGGRPGHALVAIDLDHQDAVARADEYLPPTDMVEGRPGKPRSHRYYLVPVDTIPGEHVSTAEGALAGRDRGRDAPRPTISLDSVETGKRSSASKGSGGMVVCPPSAHPSGEIRAWDGGRIGNPTVIPYPDLWAAVVRLAEAVGCRVPDTTAPRVAAKERQAKQKEGRHAGRRPGRVAGDRGVRRRPVDRHPRRGRLPVRRPRPASPGVPGGRPG